VKKDERSSTVDETLGLAADHDPAFQKMMLGLSSQNALDEDELKEIAENGKDADVTSIKNGHSENATFRSSTRDYVLKYMKHDVDSDGDGIADEDEDQEKIKRGERAFATAWTQSLLENMQDMLESLGLIKGHSYLSNSYNWLTSRGEVSEEDLVHADTSDSRVANLKVLRVHGASNQNDRYFVGDEAITRFLRADGKGVARTRLEETNVASVQQNAIDKELSKYGKMVDYSGPVALAPDLVQRIQKDQKIASYVALAQEEARKVGIDPNMYANQLWQESRFKPNAQSGAGARGIAQMMPDKVGKYGLKTLSDLNDPIKSIHAGAQMMAHLTNKYGDQRLALAAYNGGGGSIKFAAERLGKNVSDVSFKDWYDFNMDRRAQLGTAKRSAWHVETLEYTQKIALTGGDITSPSPAVASAGQKPSVVASASTKPALDPNAPALTLNS
jgi:SLT domain-containing protein